jgi:hypothetical protein
VATRGNSAKAGKAVAKKKTAAPKRRRATS